MSGLPAGPVIHSSGFPMAPHGASTGLSVTSVLWINLWKLWIAEALLCLGSPEEALRATIAAPVTPVSRRSAAARDVVGI
jgi:hypothetical protein